MCIVYNFKIWLSASKTAIQNISVFTFGKFILVNAKRFLFGLDWINKTVRC